MNGICVFLNTAVLNDTRTLSKVGDTLLAPVRYLFNGANVAMTGNKDTRAIHHVASFHERGVEHVCKTNPSFKSASKGMPRTILAVVCLIPGLILGSLIKGLSYAFSPTTQKVHALAKKHFTPINCEIGTEEPIRTEAQLKAGCEKIRCENRLNQPIDIIHIRAAKDLVIHRDPGLLDLNPMHVILEGGELAQSDTNLDLLRNKIYLSRKWQFRERLQKIEEGEKWSSKRYHTFLHLHA